MSILNDAHRAGYEAALTKFAVDAQPKEKKDPITSKLWRLGKSLVLPGVASNGLIRATSSLSDRMPQVEGSQALVDDLSRRMNLPERQTPGFYQTPNVLSSGYMHGDISPTAPVHGDFTRGTVILAPRTSEAIAAHEVGHAHNWKNLPAKAVPARMGIKAMQGVTGLGSTMYAALSKNPSYGPALTNAAVHAPELLDEGLASARAVAALVGKHGWRGGLARSLPLAPAFGTYAMTGLGPLAITALRRRGTTPAESDVAQPPPG